MTKNKVEKIIRIACDNIYLYDKYLIEMETHEQNIVAHILCYIKPQLDASQWNVDVEYNRENYTDTKRDLRGNSLKPDLIIHQRGPNGINLAAIETKGHWNTEPRSEDTDSLRRLQEKHNYKFLYRIELGENSYVLIPISGRTRTHDS